jgi:hypothetical protein
MGLGARSGLSIAGIAMIAAAVAACATTLVGMARPAVATDQDQVRAVLSTMNNSYNRSDFTAFASHVCAAMLRANNFQAGWYQSREVDGTTQITVNSVSVTGDDAVANVRFAAANHEDAKTFDVGFLREDTQWKACRYHITRVA